jgi:hypothetical protein
MIEYVKNIIGAYLTLSNYYPSFRSVIISDNASLKFTMLNLI